MSRQYNQRKGKPNNSNGGRKPGPILKRFYPLSSSTKPKHSFETVWTNFLDHVLVLSTTVKNMNDMVMSIKDRKLVTLIQPEVQVSTHPDQNIKDAEDKAF